MGAAWGGLFLCGLEFQIFLGISHTGRDVKPMLSSNPYFLLLNGDARPPPRPLIGYRWLLTPLNGFAVTHSHTGASLARDQVKRESSSSSLGYRGQAPPMKHDSSLVGDWSLWYRACVNGRLRQTKRHGKYFADSKISLDELHRRVAKS